jgi:sec-independent protein translocase protein TatC
VPVTNLLDVQDFLKLTLQLMVVFGLGFLMPVVVVGANMMGVLSAAQLKKSRTYVIFGLFVFGAVATPSTDPFSMLALSLPMIALYLIAEVICRVHDRRKAGAEAVA